MRLIGLDLDGTLEDSRDDMTHAAARVRAQLGLPPREADQLRPYVNAGMEQLYRACFDDFLGQGQERLRMEQVRLAYEAEYFANVAVHTRLYPGISDALSELAQHGQLACITNKPERISRHLLAQLGVGPLFTTVIGGDTCTESKPSPMMLRAAAEQCGFDPARGQAFMIGDTNADIQLGRAFGATTIWCAWGYLQKPSEKADHEARTPGDLPGLIITSANRS